MKYSLSLMTGLVLIAANLQAQITTWYMTGTATTTATAVDGNEFVVFRNLTAPKFRIRTSGFQVVEKS